MQIITNGKREAAGAKTLAADRKCDHRAEAQTIWRPYAALKRRSSTVLHAFVSASAGLAARLEAFQTSTRKIIYFSITFPRLARRRQGSRLDR